MNTEAGHPTLKRLIKTLRRRKDVDADWATFDRFVTSNIAEIVAAQNTRWLVSICDTYADHGPPAAARNAMIVSSFVNMVRFAETVKFVRPVVDPDRVLTARGRRVELYDGVSTFAIDEQDVFLNLTRRVNALLADDPVILPIWREVLTRLAQGDNVVSDFARESAVRDRYFPPPADPTPSQD